MGDARIPTTVLGSICCVLLLSSTTVRAQDEAAGNQVGPSHLSYDDVVRWGSPFRSVAEWDLLQQRLSAEIEASSEEYRGPDLWGPGALFVSAFEVAIGAGVPALRASVHGPSEMIYAAGVLAGVAGAMLVIAVVWLVERIYARRSDPSWRRMQDLRRAEWLVGCRQRGRSGTAFCR